VWGDSMPYEALYISFSVSEFGSEVDEFVGAIAVGVDAGGATPT
jgi:hypothetical protein